MKDKQLTLKLNSGTIDKAKAYAQRQQTSISKLLENYLETIMQEEEAPEEVSPLVSQIVGKGNKVADEVDFKKDYRAHLDQKYG